MMNHRPFEEMSTEVQSITERLQSLAETFAGEPPMFLGTAREALFLSRCALAAVQRQLDAADFLRLCRRQKGQPMDAMSQWAHELTIELAGGEDQANAFAAWLIASAVSLPQLYEDAGRALEDRATYEAWLRARHADYVAAEGKIE